MFVVDFVPQHDPPISARSAGWWRIPNAPPRHPAPSGVHHVVDVIELVDVAAAT